MDSQVIKKIKKILGKGVHFLHEPSLRGNEWKYVKKTLDDNLYLQQGLLLKNLKINLKNTPNLNM